MAQLGLVLSRRRVDGTEEIKRQHLQYALQSFDRSLQLEPDNTGKNIRAWIGQALTYHRMALYED